MIPFPNKNCKLVPGEEGYCVDTDGSAWTRIAQTGLGPGKGTSSYLGRTWKPLKPILSKCGYHLIAFKGKQRRLGCVVLETFVGPRPLGLQCRHLNGKKTDNRLENLAWGTAKQNADDRESHGTTAKGSRIANSILNEEQAIANRFGYNQSNITTILGGKRWKHVYERFWNDNPKLKKVKRSSQKSVKKTEGFGL